MMAAISLNHYDGRYDVESLRQDVSGATVSIDTAKAAIEPSSILFQDTGKIYIAYVPLPPGVLQWMTAGRTFKADIDMPHVDFYFGVHIEVKLTQQAQQVIALASRNCF